MLTPETLQDIVAYEGLSKPPSDISNIRISPYYPYYTGTSANLVWETYLKGSDEIFHSLWTVEEITINSLRVLFIPITGLCLLFYLLRKKQFLTPELDRVSHIFNLKEFSFFGIILFLLGFSICFWIEMEDLKWEFTRFVILGMIIGMLFFSILLFEH